MSCCKPRWFCTEDGPVMVESVDGEFATPDGAISGPFLTQAAAAAACPPMPVYLDCGAGGCSDPYAIPASLTVSFTDQDAGLDLDNSYELGVGTGCFGAPSCMRNVDPEVLPQFLVTFVCGVVGTLVVTVQFVPGSNGQPTNYAFVTGGAIEPDWTEGLSSLYTTINCGDAFDPNQFIGRVRIFRDGGHGTFSADLYLSP